MLAAAASGPTSLESSDTKNQQGQRIDSLSGPNGSIKARVRRLRDLAAEALAHPATESSDWGNFGDTWGDSPSFSNFHNFANGY
jgi:hypothetical protein